MSEFWSTWLLHVKDFLWSEEKQDCGNAVFIFRFLVRDGFDEVKGEKAFVGRGGVWNAVGVAIADGFIKVVGMALLKA